MKKVKEFHMEMKEFQMKEMKKFQKKNCTQIKKVVKYWKKKKRKGSIRRIEMIVELVMRTKRLE